MMYTQDYDGRFPYGSDNRLVTDYSTTTQINWIREIYPYVKSWQLFRCPSATDYSRTPPNSNVPNGNNNTNYTGNGAILAHGISQAAIEETARTVVVSETPTSYSGALMYPYYESGSHGYLLWNYTTAREVHFDGSNQVYADGHAKWLKSSNLCSINFGLKVIHRNDRGISGNLCGPLSSSQMWVTVGQSIFD